MNHLGSYSEAALEVVIVAEDFHCLTESDTTNRVYDPPISMSRYIGLRLPLERPRWHFLMFETNSGNCLKLLHNGPSIEDQYPDWRVSKKEGKDIGGDDEER